MAGPSLTYDALAGQGAAALQDAGIDDPRREARLLLAEAADLTGAGLIARGRDPVPGTLAARYTAMIARRAAREPFAHIAGRVWFHGREFMSDARALVPRPDSETLVACALELLDGDDDRTVADLGTGTGCLIATLLCERPKLTGIAVEADPHAAALAQANFERLGVSGRVKLHVGSWADWPAWAKAGMVVSNPPYIASGVIGGLDPEVRLHDPLAALDGGPDGLAAYREIIALAGTRLARGVPVLFETGYDQRAAVEGLLAAGGFERIAHARDMAGQDRVVSAFAPGAGNAG